MVQEGFLQGFWKIMGQAGQAGRYLGSALGYPEGAPLPVAAGSHVPGQLVHALLYVSVILHITSHVTLPVSPRI